MRIHVDQRRERVLALVQERGSLRVAELAGELGVSAVTLRRDVEYLTAKGKLRRLHGAVVWPGAPSLDRWTDSPPAPEGGEAEDLVVGMIVPTRNYIFADVIKGARQAVEASAGRLVLGMSGYAEAEDLRQAEHLLASGAQGLLVAPSWYEGVPAPGQADWLLDCGVPVVLLERSAPPGNPVAGMDRVRTDRAYGAAMAVGHFARLGHRKVAALLQPGPHADQIGEGFRTAVTSLGMAAVPGMPYVFEYGDYDDALDRLVTAVEEHGVTAALVHSDEDAIALVSRLRLRGISIPEDLALIAYDDEVSGLSDVPLTAVAPPKQAVGEYAAKLLVARLAELRDGGLAGPRQHLNLLPELRVRESCGSRSQESK